MSDTLAASDFAYLREFLQRRSGIVLDSDKEYLVALRLGLLRKREGLGSITALLGRLRARPQDALSRRVVEAMTTNETSFFRDRHPFEALRTHVLPQLAERRSGERALTIWCAASSSGQEPYSIAMLLRELGLCAPRWDVRIVATDLSSEMVARGRAGRYSAAEVQRGLPAPLLAKYFRLAGGEYQVAPELTAMIDFRELNLHDAWPTWPQLDLVFARNVLIYFDDPTKRQILGRIRRLMAPHGCLFLGASETTLSLDGAFHQHQHGRTCWYQQAAAPL